MRKVDELRKEIANQFASEYKAYDLENACNKYGIKPDIGLDPMNSKSWKSFLKKKKAIV